MCLETTITAERVRKAIDGLLLIHDTCPHESDYKLLEALEQELSILSRQDPFTKYRQADPHQTPTE